MATVRASTVVRSRGRRTRAERRVPTIVALVLTACLLPAACGDDGSSSPASGRSSPNTTSPPASASNAPPGADCPFSGATTPSQGDGLTSGAVLSSLTPAVAGCIDNVTVAFSTAPPAWSVAYSNGPFVDAKSGASVTPPGPVTLVVSFSGTTYPSVAGGSVPATLPTSPGNYVKGVSVFNGSGGSLEFAISLPQQLQYVTSQSKTPSNFVLSIG
jgi:hypothetical protein